MSNIRSVCQPLTRILRVFPMSRARAEMIEETRARLLASARQAFATQGYANTSMDDFTARAGLTR